MSFLYHDLMANLNNSKEEKEAELRLAISYLAIHVLTIELESDILLKNGVIGSTNSVIYDLIKRGATATRIEMIKLLKQEDPLPKTVCRMIKFIGNI